MSIVKEIPADWITTSDSSCRICLRSEPVEKWFLFECTVGGTTLVEALSIVGGIKVLTGDHYPKVCCSNCLQQVEAAYKLREQCQESNRRLSELFGDAEQASIKMELPDFDEEDSIVDGSMGGAMTSRSYYEPPEVEETSVASILHKYGLDGFTTTVEDQDLESVELFSCVLEQDLQKMLSNETVGTIVRFRKAVSHAKQLSSESPELTKSIEKKNTQVLAEQPAKKRRRMDEWIPPNKETLGLNQLLKTIEGQCITTHYQNNGNRLDKHNQGKLLRLMIENLASSVDIKDIQKNWFGVIFSAIAEAFPSEAELVEIYKAKFPYVKHNLSKKINTYSKHKPDTQPNATVGNNDDIKIEHEVFNSKNWLQNGREPWNRVLEHWNNSFQLRNKIYTNPGNEKLFELWTDWPILKQSNGIELIRQDFARMFTPSSDVFQMWHRLKKNVCAFAHMNLKNKARLGVLAKFEEGLWSDDHLYIQLLSALLSPGIVAKKYKPKFEETMSAFMREVQTANELDATIERYRIALAEHKLMVQPHVVCINGEEKRYLICVDSGRYYPAESLLDAIDGVLKLCMVLNVSYTPEAKPTWLFIQQYCYGLVTDNDTSYVCLRSLQGFCSSPKNESNMTIL